MRTLKEYAAMVEARLPEFYLAESALREGGMPATLSKSMRYSLLAGGKRLRPAMFLAAIEMLGGCAEDELDFACTIEMIHTYSLIHDDLPGMDDDCLRRGKPTNHVVFGVGQAILAGDGLLNGAFEQMLAHALKKPEAALRYLKAIAEVATGSGVTGMIAGQVVDLECEHSEQSGEIELSYIQRNKTACMFIYPMRAAAQIMGADKTTLSALSAYAEAFGRLFQTVDDLLDVVGVQDKMGKTLGKDAEEGKLTAVSLYGVEGTAQKIREYVQQAEEALRAIPCETGFFAALVEDMAKRTN